MKSLKVLILSFILCVLFLFFFPLDKDCEDMNIISIELIDKLQASGILDSLESLTGYLNDSTFKFLRGKSDLFLINSGTGNIRLEQYFQNINRENWWFNNMHRIGVGTIVSNQNKITFTFDRHYARKVDYAIELYLNTASPEGYVEDCSQLSSRATNYMKLKEHWYLKITTERTR